MVEERHKAGTPSRQLWDSLAMSIFYRIDDLRSFQLGCPTILFKVRQSVVTIDLEVKDLSCALPFGDAHIITCASLPIAYQIVMPPCRKIMVGNNYASFARKPVVSLTSETYFLDRRITIMGNSDALLIVSDTLYWTQQETMDDQLRKEQL